MYTTKDYGLLFLGVNQDDYEDTIRSTNDVGRKENTISVDKTNPTEFFINRGMQL